MGSYDVNSVPPFNSKQVVERGVAGGHFDYDMYYGKVGDGSKATAKITVGTNGQTSPFPATLGAIKVGTTILVSGLDGFRHRRRHGHRHQCGDDCGEDQCGRIGIHGKRVRQRRHHHRAGHRHVVQRRRFTIANGTSQTLVPHQPATPAVPGTAPTPGHYVITAVEQNKPDVSVKCGNLAGTASYVTGAPGNITSSNSGTMAVRLDDLFTKINGKTVNGYKWTCNKVGSPTSSLDCFIDAPVGASACSARSTDNRSRQTPTSARKAAAIRSPRNPRSRSLVGRTSSRRWPSRRSPVASIRPAATSAPAAIWAASSNKHVHEYDDKYDRTGVNNLDPSLADFNLANAIPSTSTKFKVLMSNQYLSPAATIHLNGTPSYVWNVNEGYTPVRSFMTMASLDVTTLPTYSRNSSDTTAIDPLTGATITVNALRSLVVNLPVTAFSVQDWWGTATCAPACTRRRPAA